MALAQRGIALIAVNSVGHGFGPLGSLTVNRTTSSPVAFPSGGVGVDQNGDGLIEFREGMAAAAPRRIVDERDGFQQSVADLMQLVRQIEAGIDVDDDARPDLDRLRIYYVSQSLGAMYGAVFLAVEPRVQVGVLNAVGGPRTTRTLTPAARAGIGAFLAARVPSLINAPGVTHLDEVQVVPSLLAFASITGCDDTRREFAPTLPSPARPAPSPPSTVNGEITITSISHFTWRNCARARVRTGVHAVLCGPAAEDL